MRSLGDIVQRVGLSLLGLLSLASVSKAISIGDLIASFDVLETIAGTAQVTGGGVRGWQESMEGMPATSVELSRPHMTMADWAGNYWIADKDAHAIRQIVPEGTLQTVAGTNQSGFNGDGIAVESQLSFPNGMYTFPNGTTYVLDLGNSMIRKLSLDGNLTTVFEDPAGLGAGRGLWVSPDERIIFYWTGTEVRRWTESDGISVYADGFVQLGNLTIDPGDGNVVATDREGHSVYRLAADGTKQRIAGNGSKSGGASGMPATSVGLDEVRGVHFHPGGGYFLATHDGGQIWFVDDNDVIHLLIDGDDDGTHGGDGLPLTSPGEKISEPRAVVLAPNGDLIVTEHDGGYVRRAKALMPYEMGDFDYDRVLGEDDIDAISESARLGNNLQTLDLTFDGLVDQADRHVWIRDLRMTSIGDSNLDGAFNSGDFVHVFARGQYEDGVPMNSGWGDGDWNGDGDFSSADFVAAFVAGSYTTAAATVPEPAGLGFLITVAILAANRRRPKE